MALGSALPQRWLPVVRAIAVLITPLIPAASMAAEKPNIIFIISDDHRWDGLGIAGNTNIQTPQLDRLAGEGQWYREATIQIPTCTASRASILTGVPPYTHGWYSNSTQRADVLDDEALVKKQDLLPKELAKAGYHTAFAGKWHITPEPWKFGFETVKRWMVPGAGRYKDPMLADANSSERKPAKGFTQTIFADDAIDVLQDHIATETTRPLFLWTAFTAPHSPFKPNPKSIDGKYDGKSPNQLAPETYHYDPTQVRNDEQLWQKYYEAITALDTEVGRIMDTVRNSSMSTNTLVVFIGDNGYMMGARGLFGKYVPYEDSLRVPLIVWGPDSIVGAKGTTVTASVNSLDLTPTLLKLAGGTVPSSWMGRDVSAVLKDGQPHDITWAVSSYPDHQSNPKNHPAYRVIRTPEYKLIHFHPDTKRGNELYDLKADPGEKNNLFGKPEVAEVQQKLEQQLAAFREKTGDTSMDMAGPIASFRERARKENATDQKPKAQTKGKKGKKRGRKQQRAAQQQQQQ